MGKGGYAGGGTIIGPHTPQWFGHGGDAMPAPPPAPRQPVLTRAQEAELNKLRDCVKLSRKAQADAAARLAADLAALNTRLAELGLPQET
jgi:hypothetical protein